MHNSIGRFEDVEDKGAVVEWTVRSPLGPLGQLAGPYNVDNLVLEKGVERYSYQLCAEERPVLRFWRQHHAKERYG